MGSPRLRLKALLETLGHQRLVEFFSPEIDPGRSAAYDVVRHRLLHGPRYRKALSEAALSRARPDALHLALRGRILRILGERGPALLDLRAAVSMDPGLAAAQAWLWEAQASGRAPRWRIDRAVALAPGDAWWRLWRALSLFSLDSRQAQEDLERAVVLEPSNAVAHGLLGCFWMVSRRHRRALECFDAALRLDPAMGWGFKLRALVRNRLGDRAGCLTDCAQAMRLDECVGILSIPLGMYRQQHDARPILAATDRELRRDPNSYWAYLYRGDAKRAPEINQIKSGLADLERAVELRPDFGLAHAYLSRARSTSGDAAGARVSLDRAVALEPACGWVWAWRGELRRRQGDLLGAQADLDRSLALFPDYEMAYAWRGGVRRALGRPAQALEDLDLAIRLEPSYAWSYHERMLANRLLGRTAEALKDLDLAVRRDPKYAWEDDRKRHAGALAELDAEVARRPANALAWSWRGELRIRMGDFRSAERDLTRALRSVPKMAAAFVWRGRVRHELGRPREALKDLDRAVRLDRSASAFAWRARVRHKTGDLRGAWSDIVRASKLELRSAWILCWQGEIACALRRWRDAERILCAALELDPRHFEAYLWRGAARLRLGDLPGAGTDLERAAALRPESARARFFNGLWREACGLPAEAAQNHRMALTLSGDLSPAELRSIRTRLKRLPAGPARSARDQLARAAALGSEGRHADAAALCDAVLGEDPGDVDALRTRSDAFRCMGRYDLALKDLEAVVRLRPNDADALVQQSDGKRHALDFEGAVGDAGKVLLRDPASASAWVSLSEGLRNLGRFEESIEAASRAIAAQPGWAWAYVVRAKARRQQGDLPGALQDTERAEKADSREAYAYAWRGEILRASRRPEEAVAALDKALALHPRCAWAMAVRGESKRDAGLREEGLRDILLAVRTDGQCSCAFDFLGSEPPAVRRDRSLAWVYAWRGGIHRKEERWEAAGKDLDHAVALDPRCFWALAWRGELRQRTGRLEQGLKDLDRALRIHPGYADAVVWAGQGWWSRGKAARAMASFDEALRMDPGHVWAQIGRGLCLEKTGRTAEAQEALERARTLAPGLFARAGSGSR